MPSLATVGVKEQKAGAVQELKMYLGSWMNREDMMLSEVSQSQKDKYCILHLCEVLRVIKIIDRK